MRCDICSAEIAQAHIRYDDMIWTTEGHEFQLFKPYMSVKAFQEICIRSGISKEDFYMALWCNPDGILKLLQDIDERIQGWEIPNFTSCHECSKAGKKPASMEM